MNSSTHPLQHTWVIWEHKALEKGEDWKNSMKEVCEFNSLEEFWKYWAFFPKPSDVLYDGISRKEVGGRTIEAFSVFKKGIKPEWEDPANRAGAELSCRKPFTSSEVDKYWDNMVFGLIGEVIDVGDEICGCRIIDKSKRGTCDRDKLRNNLLDALSEGDVMKSKGLPEFEFRLHNSAGAKK